HRSLRQKPEQCRCSSTALKTQRRFQRRLSPQTSRRRTCEKRIKQRKKSPGFLFSSLATATASEKVIAAFWIVLGQTTRSVAKSASRNHCFPAGCIGKASRHRRSARPSFKDNGRPWGLQPNDCGVSSTT